MSELKTLLNRLEVNLRDELTAQKRMLRALEDQESAIVGGKTEVVLESTKHIEEETRSGVTRSEARNALLGELGRLWSVPSDALTLASVAERAGAGGERLIELRTSLRELAGRVLKKNRKIAAVASLHRKVMQDVIDTIFADGSEAGGTVRSSGTLIDAEA